MSKVLQWQEVGKTAAHLVLPWIHQIFSNLKGWARGVYHGLRRKHLGMLMTCSSNLRNGSRLS